MKTQHGNSKSLHSVFVHDLKSIQMSDMTIQKKSCNASRHKKESIKLTKAHTLIKYILKSILP